ncbi:MAG: SEL1-like repeat protein [Lachnospiraceae bacterium]|nr:SEL1-like repeat protein [Lachnospiraceae bacterium]
MDGIRAGVTLMQDFCVARSSEFQSYIDYMAREEAQRNQAFQTFNVFHDYMENPEKSTGLFTATKDHLTMDEKKELKEIFQTAQDNESLMWQTVISFDNRWLEKNYVYDSKQGILDEKKLKEVARAAIGKMLEKEGMDLAVWTASFHYNTDNIHIHFATVEPYPTRELMMYQGQIERRGKFKRKNIEAAKSKVVNELMQTREINQKINQTIRRDIVKAKEQRSLAENPVFRKKFLALYESLPNLPQNMITYNNSIMSRQRKQIDEISKLYLKTYHEAEYTELKALLKHQSELYSEAYGFGQIDRSYAEGKEKELLERLGNAVLREVKQYARSMKKAAGQTMEEKEPSVGGWGMPGVGETPVFVSEEWKEDVKQNPISVELGEKKLLQDMEEKSAVEREVDVQEEVQWEATGDEEEWIEERSEESSWQSLKIHPVEKTYSEEAQEALYDMEQFFQKESVGAIGEKTERSGGKKKEDCLSKYQAWYEEFKELKANLTTEKEIPEEQKQEWIRELVIQGEHMENPFLLHQLGEWYERGQYLDGDQEIAQKYFERSLDRFLKDVYELDEPQNSKRKKFYMQEYVQYRIGKQYDRGWGTEQDHVEAAEWFRESDTGYARYALGNLYFEGKGVEQDYAKAFGLFQSVEDNPFANLKCAEMYENGYGIAPSTEKAEKHEKRAYELFRQAEDRQPDDLMEYRIGQMLYMGKGVEQNTEEAIQWLEKSAKKQNMDAEYLVCKIYIQEHMEEKTPDAIRRMEEIIEKSNYKKAEYSLGSLYTNPESGFYDLEKGIGYLELAAEQEHEYAQYRLGVLHLDPESPFFDLQKGVEYLRQSAEQGNQYAQYQLGKFYLKPDSQAFDLETGIFYLECAAEQGNENAVYLLGKSYLDPELEIYDPARGEAYLFPLAVNGNQYAQYQLGKLYLDPSTSFHDSKKGISFLKEAAEQGNQYAQVKLGLEYLKNENVGRDLSEARFWLGKAAEQGNELSEKILNDLHTQGIRQRMGGKSGAGELDRALRYLQRALEEEHWKNLQIMRQYELEQEEMQEELG